MLAAQPCPTLWQPHGVYSPPGSSVHGILQARTVEWVAISSSRGSCQPSDGTWVSGIAGRIFNVWAIRRTPKFYIHKYIYIYTHTHKGWHSIVSREGFPHPQDKGLVGPLDGVQEHQMPEAMQSSAEWRLILKIIQSPTREKGHFWTWGGQLEMLTWKISPFYFLDTMICSQLFMYLSIHLLFVNVYTWNFFFSGEDLFEALAKCILSTAFFFFLKFGTVLHI